MKVIIASSFVPFVNGGGRFIVEWLEEKLLEYGHEVEKFYLPFNEQHDKLLENLLSYRLLDISNKSDRLITIRPPAHSIIHPNKVVWFIHHLRGYYDLAETKHTSVPDTGEGRAIRDALHRHDTMALKEARTVFTNSSVVGDRLKKYNGIASKTLFPPLLSPDRFYCGEPNDEIVSVCRLETHKRQHLFIEAMSYVKTPVKLRICGKSSGGTYEQKLQQLAHTQNVEDKVHFDFGWISEKDKIKYVSNSLACVYAPEDEDSYGYPTLEAAAAEKPTLTTWDAGGTLEFIRDGENGLITEPSPQDIAEGFDKLYLDQNKTKQMGQAAADTVRNLNITWDHVIESLLNH